MHKHGHRIVRRDANLTRWVYACMQPRRSDYTFALFGRARTRPSNHRQPPTTNLQPTPPQKSKPATRNLSPPTNRQLLPLLPATPRRQHRQPTSPRPRPMATTKPTFRTNPTTITQGPNPPTPGLLPPQLHFPHGKPTTRQPPHRRTLALRQLQPQ